MQRSCKTCSNNNKKKQKQRELEESVMKRLLQPYHRDYHAPRPHILMRFRYAGHLLTHRPHPKRIRVSKQAIEGSPDMPPAVCYQTTTKRILMTETAYIEKKKKKAP